MNFVDRSTVVPASWLNQVDATINSSPITAIATVTPAADRIPYFSGAASAALADFTTFGRSVVACASATALAAILSASFDPAGSAAAAIVTANAYTDAGLVLKANIASPTLTGVPAAPTAAPGTNTTQLATTAFVAAAVSTVDLSLYAKLANPTFTGVPAAPTAAPGTNTTQIATTAFVIANVPVVDLSAYATLANPTFTGVPAAPTAGFGTNTTQIATTAFVLANQATVDLSPYLTSANAALTYAPIASPTFTGTVTLPALTYASATSAGTVATGRITLIPNVTYNLDGVGGPGAVLSSNVLCRNADSFVVPTGKQTDLFSLRNSLETQGTGTFCAIDAQTTVTTTNSGYNYGIVASLVLTAGTGKGTAMYARAGTNGAYAGILVGLTAAITPTAATPTSTCVALSVDGPGGGWGMNMSSNTASDCGWGFQIDGSVEIRNAAIGQVKFTGAHTYEPDFFTLYENDAATVTYAVKSDGSTRYTPATAVIRYDLVGNVVGAGVYIAPTAFTVATGKQFEGVSIRPGNITLSGTAVYAGFSSVASVVASAAGASAFGMSFQVLNSGAGPTYGNSIYVGAAAGHTGNTIGSLITTKMVVGSGSTVVYDAVFDGATSYETLAAFRARGSAAGDKLTYAFRVDATALLSGAALYYDQRTGSTAAFLTQYDNANSRKLFEVDSNGNVTLGATGQTAAQYIQGDFSNATVQYRAAFRSRITDGNTVVMAIPNGTATTASWRAYNKSDVTAALNFSTFGQVNTITIVDANIANAGTQGTMELRIGGAAAFKIDALKNVIIGTGSAISTSATDGFPYVPTCAGTPTGAPTAVTGALPWVIDSTNKIPYFWNGSAWVTFITGTGGGAPASGASLGMVVAHSLGMY